MYQLMPLPGNVVLGICLGLGISRPLALAKLVGVSSRSAGATKSMVMVSTVTMSRKMLDVMRLLHGEVIISPVPAKDTREDGATAEAIKILKKRIGNILAGQIMAGDILGLGIVSGDRRRDNRQTTLHQRYSVLAVDKVLRISLCVGLSLGLSDGNSRKGQSHKLK
jgi:hypothetical protein